MPQAPQLAESAPVSTHAAPQRVVPGRHVQLPAPQTSASPHALPHPPQLRRSFWTSVHRPPQVCAVFGHVHDPPWQTGVALGHEVPQAPQLRGSVDVSTQRPPHVVPVVHAHTPDVHEAPGSHALPHAPQFASSADRSRQVPAQLTLPGGHAPHAPSTHAALPSADVASPAAAESAASSGNVRLEPPQAVTINADRKREGSRIGSSVSFAGRSVSGSDEPDQAPQTPSRQFGRSVGQLLSSLHSTHARSRQNGLPGTAAQSLASAHCPQRPSAQTGVAPLQWAFDRHARQSPLATSQCGVEAGHAASDVQPDSHRLSPLQIGEAAGQSAFVRHATHLPSATRQRGAAVPHCALEVHATHRRVVGSQKGRPVPAQSASPTQPTQAPVPGSHFGWSPRQTLGSLEHEALHTWFSGQHAGADAGQSAFVAQTSQRPRTQRGSAAPHWTSLVHSTHPSPGSQTFGAVHPSPHRPPAPPPGPMLDWVDALDPHEAATRLLPARSTHAPRARSQEEALRMSDRYREPPAIRHARRA